MDNPLLRYTSETLSKKHTQLGQDGKDGKTYLVQLKKKITVKYNGNNIKLDKKHKVAVKTFKPKKSPQKIAKEAEYQHICSSAGISPPIYAVHTKEKYIAMMALDSLPAQTYKNKSLPDTLQYMICALMERLDNIGILHGDMNALNVMLDVKKRPYMIDFGFAKKITQPLIKKHGNRPNFSISLWGLVRGFKRHKVKCDIMEACMKSAKSQEDISPYIEEGERLLELLK
jgi:predicted Ser/Thr protein kinase